jgi:hypothetical protein
MVLPLSLTPLHSLLLKRNTKLLLLVSPAASARQVFQEMHGPDADAALNIPIFTDSQSGVAVASSDRDTRRTRHIQRRHHCMRIQTSNGTHIILKIEGPQTISGIGTKLQDFPAFPITEPSSMLKSHPRA